MRIRAVAVLLCAGAVLVGCGTGEERQDPKEPTGGGSATGCPVTQEELSDATSLSWELEETREHHPLETMESVEVTACLYTAPEAEQMGGDPLVARVDVVAPADAAAVLADFSSICGELGGSEQKAGDGVVCDRDGVVVDGHIGDLVLVSIVNADTATATTLTPSFEKILASAG